jgi:guanylate kinase
MSEAPREERRWRTGHGRLIVITGPSGVGKDTVMRELFELDPSLRYCVSYTTRPRRPDESDGVAYWFVDEGRFRHMIEHGEFLEWSTVYGHLYGRSLDSVRGALARGDDVVLKIDVQGAAKIRERVRGDAIFVFLLPPSRDVLDRRLVERATEDPASLEARRTAATLELAEKDKYDHQVVNDDAKRAAGEILGIIEADRDSRDSGEAHG